MEKIMVSELISAGIMLFVVLGITLVLFPNFLPRLLRKIKQISGILIWIVLPQIVVYILYLFLNPIGFWQSLLFLAFAGIAEIMMFILLFIILSTLLNW
jgi:hypothetical protein